MPFYDPRDPKAPFTGFGLSDRNDEPDKDDEPDDDLSEIDEKDEQEELQQFAQSYGLTVDQLEDAWGRFRDRQTVMNVCNAIVAAGFFFGVHTALKSLSIHLAVLDGPALFRVMYQPAMWWFLPGFGSVCLAWEITIQIWSLFAGRQKIRLYRAWVKQGPFVYRGAPFQNQLAIYHWFSVIIVLPLAVFTLLALNMHTNIGPEGIRACGYAFKACEVLPFNDLVSIRFGPANRKGKANVGSRVILGFKDGRKWDSSEWTGASDDIDPALVQFLLRNDPRLGKAHDAS
jgi:hypothetical protein